MLKYNAMSSYLDFQYTYLNKFEGEWEEVYERFWSMERQGIEIITF